MTAYLLIIGFLAGVAVTLLVWLFCSTHQLKRMERQQTENKKIPLTFNY